MYGEPSVLSTFSFWHRSCELVPEFPAYFSTMSQISVDWKVCLFSKWDSKTVLYKQTYSWKWTTGCAQLFGAVSTKNTDLAQPIFMSCSHPSIWIGVLAYHLMHYQYSVCGVHPKSLFEGFWGLYTRSTPLIPAWQSSQIYSFVHVVCHVTTLWCPRGSKKSQYG